MACPYFVPQTPLAKAAAAFPRPLGDAWLGLCCANSPAVAAATEQEQLEWCNMGYASGKCARFVPGGPDAVRFSIAADSGSRVRLLWCAERGHLPFAHGALEYDRDTGALSPVQTDVLEAQARAYLAVYLRRRDDRSSR
jgi:hypothetical protein